MIEYKSKHIDRMIRFYKFDVVKISSDNPSYITYELKTIDRVMGILQQTYKSASIQLFDKTDNIKKHITYILTERVDKDGNRHLYSTRIYKKKFLEKSLVVNYKKNLLNFSKEIKGNIQKFSDCNSFSIPHVELIKNDKNRIDMDLVSTYILLCGII